MTNTSEDVVKAAAIQLTHQLHSRLRAIEQFTGFTYPNVRADLQKKALALVTTLHERGNDQDQMLEDRAKDVCRLLFGEKQHPPAEFWSTKLGADVAWAIGYPPVALGEEIPRQLAAAVLRMSRQRAWKILGNEPITAETLRSIVRGSARWRELAVTV